MLKKIDGAKTYIGIMCAGILGIVVGLSDTITWETSWVVVVGSLVATWTGVSYRHAIKKVR